MKKPIQPILQPPVLSLYKELHDVKEIARRIDNRPLCELLAQVKDAFQQILVRAHAGDDEALAHYYNATRQAVMSFDNLVKHELKRTRNIAEFCPHLPVLLSSNPQDIKAAKERVRLLNVGAKAILPTRSGQRTDRRNHWTRLAIFAFDACLKNNQQTPQLEAHLKGVKQKQVKRKSWGTVVGETEYELPNGQRIVIADWQRDCGKLAEQVTKDNFTQWQSVIKMCVLEFWHRSKNEYDEALKVIGDSESPESSRRHLAMNRTMQAFKSQFLPQ